MEKNKLKLITINEDLKYGIKKDGTKYTVRNDRRRYFFPDEWSNFISLINNKQDRFFYLTLLHTGGRAMEVLNLRHKDINQDRSTIIFTSIKQRKAKKDFSTLSKSRKFFVASNYIKEYKSFIRGHVIKENDYLFLDNSKLPKNYSELNNKDKRKYFMSKFTGYSQKIKIYIKKAGIKDWYNFSPHSFRKTYGMWIRIFIHDKGELCYRMGLDYETYISHYGSSLIFTDAERRKISRIYGEVQ